jgi:hypothetical protein
MRTFLAVFAALLLSACGLMPPEVESVEQDLTAPAKICGDSSYVVAILFYDNITVNVMAVDDQLAPSFREEKRNLIGMQTIPNLDSYCVSMSPGEHKITFLAERGRGMGTTGGYDYYVGSCAVRVVQNGEYTVVPKRSGDWYEEVFVHLRAHESGDALAVCELTKTPRDALLELLKDMRH